MTLEKVIWTALPNGTDADGPELKDLCGDLVDGRRIELPTSALRTLRSPS